MSVVVCDTVAVITILTRTVFLEELFLFVALIINDTQVLTTNNLIVYMTSIYSSEQGDTTINLQLLAF